MSEMIMVLYLKIEQILHIHRDIDISIKGHFFLIICSNMCSITIHKAYVEYMWCWCWFFFIKIYCNRTCEWNGKVIGIFTLILYYYYFPILPFLLKNFIVIPVRTQSQPFGLNNSFWGFIFKGNKKKVYFSSIFRFIWPLQFIWNINQQKFMINDIYHLTNWIIWKFAWNLI